MWEVFTWEPNNALISCTLIIPMDKLSVWKFFTKFHYLNWPWAWKPTGSYHVAQSLASKLISYELCSRSWHWKRTQGQIPWNLGCDLRTKALPRQDSEFQVLQRIWIPTSWDFWWYFQWRRNEKVFIFCNVDRYLEVKSTKDQELKPGVRHDVMTNDYQTLVGTFRSSEYSEVVEKEVWNVDKQVYQSWRPCVITSRNSCRCCTGALPQRLASVVSIAINCGKTSLQ